MADGTIARTETRDLRSRHGRDYRIFVSRPAADAPPPGYPVLYLLDGNATFASAAMGVALQSRRPEVTGVVPAVVVGIGYPVDDYLDSTRRTYDYTPEVSPEALSRRPDGSAWPATGGADRFLDFIELELKPAIARMFPTDPARQAIFGHSFGGLFVLNALFTRPGTFRSYMAASPSIWFGNRTILGKRDAFLAGPPPVLRSDLLVTVGDAEQASTDPESQGAGDTAKIDWIKKNRMVENAAELAGSLSGTSRLNVTFKQFEGENHSSVLLPAIGRSLRFALGPGSS
jgi:predicted alpha/beta superfamily hydrolase